MNTIIKYCNLEACLCVLVVAFATVSICFGVGWSLYASVLLHA